MDCSMPGLPVHHELLEFTQTHIHWVSDAIKHLILCRPLLLLPSIFPSIRVFSNESVLCIRCLKYWSFCFSIRPSSENPDLISFRMDWFDLLAVQGTFKRLLQHHSSKASILWCSAIFIVQLSQPYMTTGKTIALNRWTFVGKVMSLFFNIRTFKFTHSYWCLLSMNILYLVNPCPINDYGRVNCGSNSSLSYSTSHILTMAS